VLAAGSATRRSRSTSSKSETRCSSSRSQAALNLTTIDYAEADADIKRVLDSATGDFKDEFQRNSIGFADVMRKAQAKTTGTVTAAGNEFVNGDTAQILVAMS